MSRNKSKKPTKKRKATPSRFPAKRLPLLLAFLGGAILIIAAVALMREDETDPNFVPEVSGAPHLVVDKEYVDLGDIPINQVVRVEFELTNVGDRALRFTQAPYTELVEGC